MKELGRPTPPVTPLFEARPVVGTPYRTTATPADTPSPIGAFRLVTPESRTRCEPKSTGDTDSRVVVLEEQRKADTCEALEVAIQRPARMFVLGQSSSGHINWISPEPCRGRSEMGTPVEQGETFRFSLSNRSGPLRLGNGPMASWVYVIAIADRSEQETRRILRRLVDGEPLGLCAHSRSHPVSPDGWQRHLDALRTESGGKLEWRAIHFMRGKQRLTHL